MGSKDKCEFCVGWGECHKVSSRCGVLSTKGMPVLRYRCLRRSESIEDSSAAVYLTMRITPQGRVVAILSSNEFVGEVSKRLCDKGEEAVIQACRADKSTCEVLSVEM